jgi:hypothetical protein
MTAKAPKTEAPATTPDESTRPAEVEGKCNNPMTTAEGALDRCHKAKGHEGDHVSWTSYNRAVEKAKADRAVYAAWRQENDPEVKAKREAAVAKKMATLTALAEELGFDLVAKA